MSNLEREVLNSYDYENSTNTIIEYKNIISKNPVLTNNEHIKLLNIYNYGTKKDKDIAKETLIIHNLSLVWKVAEKYFSSSIELEDLLQIGIIGLTNAIDSYDSKQGAAFSTFAYVCINNYIQLALCNTGNLVKVPRKIFYNNNKIKKYIHNFLLENDCKPSDSNIIENIDVTKKDLDLYYDFQKEIVSLEKIISQESNSPLMDVIEYDCLLEENPVIESENKDFVLQGILSSNISTKAKDILILYFGFIDNNPYSIVQIAKLYNVSKQNIHYLLHKALNSLRSDEVFLNSLKQAELVSFVRTRKKKDNA